MVKKMHDIVSPKQARKAASMAKAVPPVKKLKPERKKPAVKHHKEILHTPVVAPELEPVIKSNKTQKSPLVRLLVAGALVLFLVGVYGFFKLPKAEIEIWPKTEVLTLQETINTDKSVSQVSLATKTIPAQYVEIIKNGQQDFPATGIASNEGKATGVIKIYNKISPASSFALKIGTHFLSDSGKYFVTTQKITIPAARGGTPGSVNVTVEAKEAGEDHNIGASKFSLPKLSGTEYYYSIYGESTSAMTGGYTGRVKKVSDDDLQNAKSVLTKQLISEAETELKAGLAPGDILVDGAIYSNVVNTISSLAVGAVADTFSQSAQVKVTALTFKQQDVDELVKSNINATLTDAKNYLEKSVSINYNPKLIDIQGGKQVIDTQITATTYHSIDTIDLVNSFSQKTGDQMKKIMDQKYEGKILESKISFWPFWVTKTPSNKNRIKIDLNF